MSIQLLFSLNDAIKKVLRNFNTNIHLFQVLRMHAIERYG